MKHNAKTAEHRDIDDRFWSKVAIPADVVSGCWEWASSKNINGYGQFSMYGRPRSAHRVSWELLNGPILPGPGHHGTCVLHRCDNPPCVNPAHLFLGSNRDNILDRNAKGRDPKGYQLKGGECGHAKLTATSVVALREAHAAGASFTGLGKMFGISRAAAANVVKRMAWGHIK